MVPVEQRVRDHSASQARQGSRTFRHEFVVSKRFTSILRARAKEERIDARLWHTTAAERTTWCSTHRTRLFCIKGPQRVSSGELLVVVARVAMQRGESFGGIRRPRVFREAPSSERTAPDRTLPGLPGTSTEQMAVVGWTSPGTDPTSHLWGGVCPESCRARSRSKAQRR